MSDDEIWISLPSTSSADASTFVAGDLTDSARELAVGATFRCATRNCICPGYRLALYHPPERLSLGRRHRLAENERDESVKRHNICPRKCTSMSAGNFCNSVSSSLIFIDSKPSRHTLSARSPKHLGREIEPDSCSCELLRSEPL